MRVPGNRAGGRFGELDAKEAAMHSANDPNPRGAPAGAVQPRPQTLGLSRLLAEMTGLAAVIPGLAPVRLPDGAEVEAAFDNMPV